MSGLEKYASLCTGDGPCTCIANVDLLDFCTSRLTVTKFAGVLYELPELGSSLVDPSHEHQVDVCR